MLERLRCTCKPHSFNLLSVVIYDIMHYAKYQKAILKNRSGTSQQQCWELTVAHTPNTRTCTANGAAKSISYCNCLMTTLSSVDIITTISPYFAHYNAKCKHSVLFLLYFTNNVF